MNIWSTAWTSTDKHANEATERIAHIEQLVGRLTLALEIQKKALGKSAEIRRNTLSKTPSKYPKQKHIVELNTSQQRDIVETLRADFSVRQICEVLGINKSTVYYQAKNNLSEVILREEIERLAARYPTYGYRRITKLLIRIGYTVGYRRVARLMKAANLSVSVKRILYCHRKFRPLSEPRLCYNSLIERSIRTRH